MLEVAQRIDLTSHTFVELLEHGNDDDTVRDAARVSHAGCAKDASPNLIRYLAHNLHFTPFAHVRHAFNLRIPETDELLEWSFNRLPGWSIRPQSHGRYRIEGSLYNWLAPLDDLPPMTERMKHAVWVALAERGCRASVEAFIGEDALKNIEIRLRDQVSERKHNHHRIDPIMNGEWVTFRIEAPLIVLRQLMRSNHEIVYNEVSRRYISDAPAFYEPDQWREKPAKSIKQGSGAGVVRRFSADSINKWIAERGAFPFAIDLDTAYRDWIQTGGELYRLFDEAGVAPELSRILLPQSMYSTIWMSMSHAALRRFTDLRSNRGAKNHAQHEICEISRAMEELTKGSDDDDATDNPTA